MNHSRNKYSHEPLSEQVFTRTFVGTGVPTNLHRNVCSHEPSSEWHTLGNPAVWSPILPYQVSCGHRHGTIYWKLRCWLLHNMIRSTCLQYVLCPSHSFGLGPHCYPPVLNRPLQLGINSSFGTKLLDLWLEGESVTLLNDRNICTRVDPATGKGSLLDV